MPHVNKKTNSEKANFCADTIFWIYFKTRGKKFTLVLFLFCRDQNHYSILTSKLIKMCEQILKKQRPNTFQIRWIVKNQERGL